MPPVTCAMRPKGGVLYVVVLLLLWRRAHIISCLDAWTPRRHISLQI